MVKNSPNYGIRIFFFTQNGVRCSHVVELPIRVKWVVGSIPHGGHMEQFYHSIQCSTTGATKAVVCAILSVDW